MDLKESTVDLMSKTEENDSLKDGGMMNVDNDINRKEGEDNVNDFVNEVSTTSISNNEVADKEKKKEAGIDNEETRMVGVASQENIFTRGTNEKNDLNHISHKTNIATNSDPLDLGKDSETSKPTSSNMQFNFDGKNTNNTIYRSGNINDEVTSDSGSDSTSSEDEQPKKPVVKEKSTIDEEGVENLKVKGELGIQDLPPIEDLKITVDEKVNLVCVGLISTIIDSLVIIQSLDSESSPLNDDSILFLEDRTSLGQVFEIFGPVRRPLYSVRFNSSKDIIEKGLEVGTKIFYAPKELQYTKYVFVQDLMKQKGSDASWEHDWEPPEKFLDYSDDEQERTMKKNKKKSHVDNSENDTETSKEDRNQTQRRRDPNNPFFLKKKSLANPKNKHHKKYEGNVSNQGYRNEPEFNPQQHNRWRFNTNTGPFPPNGPRNQPFDASSNRFPNAFHNRHPNPSSNWHPNPSSNWHPNPSNNWSTNPSNNWSTNPSNQRSQTENKNWIPNLNKWPPTNDSNRGPTNSFNSWSQNVINSSSIPNNWSEISLNSWTQNNPNIPTQNTVNVPPQNNLNSWPSNWPNNWPPDINSPPPNLFSIPPPNVPSSFSNSTSNPSTSHPNHPPLHAQSWTQNPQLSSPPPQTQGFPSNNNQWPPEHVNSSWNQQPHGNSYTSENY